MSMNSIPAPCSSRLVLEEAKRFKAFSVASIVDMSAGARFMADLWHWMPLCASCPFPAALPPTLKVQGLNPPGGSFEAHGSSANVQPDSSSHLSHPCPAQNATSFSSIDLRGCHTIPSMCHWSQLWHIVPFALRFSFWLIFSLSLLACQQVCHPHFSFLQEGKKIINMVLSFSSSLCYIEDVWNTLLSVPLTCLNTDILSSFTTIANISYNIRCIYLGN